MPITAVIRYCWKKLKTELNTLAIHSRHYASDSAKAGKCVRFFLQC